MTDDPIPTPAPPPRSTRMSLTMALRAVQVRLRFVVILAVAFLVAGQWETLRGHGDRWMGSFRGNGPQAHAVSPDTEYFCPMDPGVVSEWPGKCAICNMGLVRRKTGDRSPLPSGVMARMQFSPYRVQLAGLQTAPVGYERLAREVILVGTVCEGPSSRSVEADLFERDRAFVAAGQDVEVTFGDATGQPSLPGKVARLLGGNKALRPRAVLDVEDSGALLRPGMSVTARVRRPLAELEPFRSMPSDPPPVRKGALIAVYVCPEHPDVLGEQRGRCPLDRKDELERRPLLPNQRVGWWCPMHPKRTEDRPGLDCRACGGMKLVPRVVTYRPAGAVLTVPESAVVDTGDRTVVFVERMAGLFDGVEVVLGPRCGDFYPVVRGVEPGQRVVTAGAFLLDAETRLNPGLAARYFGSGRGPRPAADSTPAGAQGVCPVTGKRLGSMGPPVRVSVAGKAVWICCDGCEEALRKAPEEYLH